MLMQNRCQIELDSQKNIHVANAGVDVVGIVVVMKRVMHMERTISSELI